MRLPLLYALLTAATAGAQIAWKQSEERLSVHPTQVSADAIFEFTNSGPGTVSFSNIGISCGCLTAGPLKPSYDPGESGRLVISFNLRNRQGPQSKHVRVETDDGRRAVLSIIADIPQAFIVEPKLLNWKPGDDAEQKTVHLSNPNGMPIRLLSISSSHEGLPAELKALREGFEYEVVVSRRPGTVNARSVVRIETEPPPGLKKSKPIIFYVFAQ